MRTRRVYLLASLASLVIAYSSCSRTPSDGSQWEFHEPPPSQPAEPERTLPPVESVPGTSFSWAPDDVDVFFHRREHAAPQSELEQWKKDHSEGRYELKVFVWTAMTLEEQLSLGVNSRQESEMVVWRGLGGPFLHDGLHMFECATERSDILWITSDYLVWCFGSSVSIIFGAGEEPVHETHVEVTRLPEWLRDWYETVHVKIIDQNPGGLGLRVVESPDYPVEISSFFYLNSNKGMEASRYLDKHDTFQRDHVHGRVFSWPDRLNGGRQ